MLNRTNMEYNAALVASRSWREIRFRKWLMSDAWWVVEASGLLCDLWLRVECFFMVKTSVLQLIIWNTISDQAHSFGICMQLRLTAGH